MENNKTAFLMWLDSSTYPQMATHYGLAISSARICVPDCLLPCHHHCLTLHHRHQLRSPKHLGPWNERGHVPHMQLFATLQKELELQQLAMARPARHIGLKAQ